MYVTEYLVVVGVHVVHVTCDEWVDLILNVNLNTTEETAHA